MSQIFDKDGRVIPTTLIQAGPCQVTQIKTKEKDGYEAIQIGFEKREKRVKKSAAKKPFRYLREFKDKTDSYKVGDEINTSLLKEGEIVKISGTSKGKGYQGVVKRWGFAGRPSTHGTKHESRTPGSIGTSFPERVIKGRKMPGRMGAERVTVKNLKIVKVDPENNLIAVRGAIPGRNGGTLEIFFK